jgi:hypothetical protein
LSKRDEILAALTEALDSDGRLPYGTIAGVARQLATSPQYVQQVASSQRLKTTANRERTDAILNEVNVGVPAVIIEKNSRERSEWTWDTAKGRGRIDLVSAEREPNWTFVLEHLNLDPNDYEIVGQVNVRAWDANVGNGEIKTLYYYKADVKLRRTPEDVVREADLEATIASLLERPAPPVKRHAGNLSFVALAADWQIGKADGDGVEGTVRRIEAGIFGVKDRYDELFTVGRKLGTLIVAGMGDLIEQCANNYAQQTFTVQLNRRDQEKLARRLLVKAIDVWARDFERVIVLAVPGNHGENRTSVGHSYTNDADNSDVALMETVAEVFARTPGFEHVSFIIPNDEMSVVLDVSGTLCGFTHAHKAENSAGAMPQAKIKTWWSNQAFGGQVIGEVTLLFTAHYHHFSVIEHGNKAHFQCPTQDGGSKWHRDATGVDSPQGMLTVVVGDGWYSDLEVIR